MKCSKCPQRASINMHQHHLALCKDHFLKWVLEQTQRFIEKYDMFTFQERILVAVSGGKDSLSLWDVLWKMGYQADGMYINLGIEKEDGYSNRSEKFARDFADQRGLLLHIVDVQNEYGARISELAQRAHRGTGRVCSTCGLVKRHIMNQTALLKGYHVLVTAHNLDDEAAVLFGNVLNWAEDFLKRQSPVLEAAPGFVRKSKPFCRFYERETAAYALLNSIPYIEDECPFSVGSKQLFYKDALNRIEEQYAGSKLRFYLGFIRSTSRYLVEENQPTHYDQFCPSCGQPTTSTGLCSFCRLIHPDQATSR